MTGELKINDKDAYTLWGVNMGEGFLNALLEPCSLKDYVENTSRLEHGKHIIVDEPKLASREVTLQFTLLGDNATDFATKRNSFLAELYKGTITLKVPQVSNDTYTLVYRKNVSFAVNTKRTMCKINVKFEEPNPANR